MKIARFTGVLVLKKNKILLVKESHKEARGLWSFPLGHLEINESLQEGAIRETKEETGYDVALSQKFKEIILDNQEFKSTSNFNDKKIKLIIFKARNIIGDIKKGNDILDAKWFNIDELDLLKLRGAWVKKVIDFLI